MGEAGARGVRIVAFQSNTAILTHQPLTPPHPSQPAEVVAPCMGAPIAHVGVWPPLLSTAHSRLALFDGSCPASMCCAEQWCVGTWPCSHFLRQGAGGEWVDCVRLCCAFFVTENPGGTVEYSHPPFLAPQRSLDARRQFVCLSTRTFVTFVLERPVNIHTPGLVVCNTLMQFCHQLFLPPTRRV